MRRTYIVLNGKTRPLSSANYFTHDLGDYRTLNIKSPSDDRIGKIMEISLPTPGAEEETTQEEVGKTPSKKQTSGDGGMAGLVSPAPAVIPERYWANLDSKGERARLSRLLIEDLNRRQNDHNLTVAWTVSSEAALFSMLDVEQQRAFARRLLKRKVQLGKAEVLESLENVRVEKNRVELGAQAVALAQESVAAMQRMRSIAKWAPAMLVATTIFAAWLIWFQVSRTPQSNGYELSLFVFVMALFAASPAVILLFERPLKGLDDWSPAPKSEDSKKAGDSSTKSATDTSAKT